MNGICDLCGRYLPIERHHVYPGPFRKKSDKYGAVADLCHWCHNEPPDGVHHNRDMAEELKREYQIRLMEENGWTEEQFIKEFGRSYF